MTEGFSSPLEWKKKDERDEVTAEGKSIAVTRTHFFSSASYYPCKDLALTVILMELINSIPKSNTNINLRNCKKAFLLFSLFFWKQMQFLLRKTFFSLWGPAKCPYNSNLADIPVRDIIRPCISVNLVCISSVCVCVQPLVMVLTTGYPKRISL